jgi:hypothetical protein
LGVHGISPHFWAEKVKLKETEVVDSGNHASWGLCYGCASRKAVARKSWVAKTARESKQHVKLTTWESKQYGQHKRTAETYEAKVKAKARHKVQKERTLWMNL